MTTLHLISAGAAKGLVQQQQAAFEQRAGVEVAGVFGAVGAMKETFTSGAACDVIISTVRVLDDLAQEGLVDRASMRTLGRVDTGVAVLRGQPHPPLGDAALLEAALLRASALYFPDPERATAGIHFMSVLSRLQLQSRLASRLRPYPHGAAAMQALAQSGDVDALGCTQATEILYTPGVELAGALPPPFELSTVYAAAQSARSTLRDEASRFIAMLCSEDVREDRARSGFAPA